MTFSNILSELKNAYGTVQSIATKLNIQLPTQFPTQVVKLKECLEVYNTCKTGIATVVMDARQEFSLESLAKLTTDIDKNWDKFAKEYNDLFNSSTSAQQANVLETFAKTHFGDKVFNTGSVIKNETPNILNGILTFQSGIDSFKGSYRNPHEATNKIRQGVDNIVGATEQVAQSLNQIYKLIKGKGTLNNVPGHPVLDALSDLHKNKVVATGIGITHTAADGFEVLDEGKQLADAVKAGDLKGTIAAGEAFTDAVKKVIKDINGITQQQPSSPNSSNIKASSNDQNSNTNNSKNRQQEKDKEKENKGKADSYVCSGATLKCSFGDKNSKLSVYPDRTVFLTERPMANISDHTSMYNIWPFGKCRTVSYPSTGSATAAAHGKLTPMPCIPGTVTEWLNGKSDYIIKGKPALLKSSYCRCQWGGIITIIDDGQVDTGSADMNRAPTETFETWDMAVKDIEMPDVNSILDGLQLGLSVAGFVPGLGAIPDLLNAAISAARGNWADAGLSIVSAIPLIGDITTGIKFVKIGVNTAKTAKISKSIKAGEKVRGEIPATVVNKLWKKRKDYNNPPYKLGGKVQSIELIEDTTFVRVYSKHQSGMKGQWVMRKEDVKGLTPKEIKNKFALPDEPQYICEVELPKGTRMHKGSANEVKIWGKGGGTQYDLRFKDVGTFKNETVIKDYIK